MAIAPHYITLDTDFWRNVQCDRPPRLLHTPRTSDTPDMQKDPIRCPFCGGAFLQELDPTGLETEEAYWTIFHWQCLECEETFDKLIAEPYEDDFEDEDTNGGTDH